MFFRHSGHKLIVSECGLEEKRYDDISFHEEKLPIEDYISQIGEAFEKSVVEESPDSIRQKRM